MAMLRYRFRTDSGADVHVRVQADGPLGWVVGLLTNLRLVRWRFGWRTEDER